MSAQIRSDIAQLKRDVDELKRQVAGKAVEESGQVIAPAAEEGATPLAGLLDDDVVSALAQAGYSYDSQVRAVTDEALLAVKGIGPATLKKVREVTG